MKILRDDDGSINRILLSKADARTDRRLREFIGPTPETQPPTSPPKKRRNKRPVRGGLRFLLKNL